jgi:NifU-like protein
VRQEMESEKRALFTEKRDFASSNIIQKHQAIEKVLDEHVRPTLLVEGGNLEVVDMKEDGDAVVVFIGYLGSCAGCPSSKTGTQAFIEESLKRELDPSIRVVVI